MCGLDPGPQAKRPPSAMLDVWQTARSARSGGTRRRVSGHERGATGVIDRAALLAWIVLIPTRLLDNAGNHFLARQLPHEAAEAFATVCAENSPFPFDPDAHLCGAWLVVQAGLESRFSLHPNGSNDHGHAAGPFQEWRGGDARTFSWLTASRHFISTTRDAMRMCPDQFIAPIAGERCGESRYHVSRWAQVVRIVREP
jgi:hypothetical protein